MNKKILTVALAFVGIAVGAGFASGQEVLQYFVGFGPVGILAALGSAIIFGFAGMVIIQLSSFFLAEDHNAVFGGIAHPVLARIFDAIISFTLFCIGFVMIAGGGSNLNQQFGLPTWVGAVIIAGLVIAVGMLDVDKVTAVIGAVTPVLVVFVVIIGVYSLTHVEVSVAQITALTADMPTPVGNPILSAMNYVSLALTMLVSMAIVMGGEISDPKVAGRGGLIGGSLYGLLLVIVTVSLTVQIGRVKGSDMPTLALVNHIAGWLGTIMAIVIFLMIFNTAIGMFYALATRFSGGSRKRARINIVVMVAVGFALSFVGFSELVGWLYPVIGYAGFLLIGVLIYAWVTSRSDIEEESGRRARLTHLFRIRLRKDRDFSKVHTAQLKREVEESPVDNDQLVEAMTSEVVEQLDDEGIEH